MNEKIEWMIARRSCRKFEDRPVKKEDLQEMALAACHAPSARNRQLWQFTVVDKAEYLERLYLAVGKALGREDYTFYGAPAMILCSNDRENPFGREDCACAMENIYLSAHALSLGAVWINQVTPVCDCEEIRSILRSFGVPDSHVVYGCAAIGYAASEPVEKSVSDSVVWAK